MQSNHENQDHSYHLLSSSFLFIAQVYFVQEYVYTRPPVQTAHVLIRIILKNGFDVCISIVRLKRYIINTSTSSHSGGYNHSLVVHQLFINADCKHLFNTPKTSKTASVLK